MSDLKDFDIYWMEKGQKLVDETFTNLFRHLNNYNVYLKALLGFYAAIGLVKGMLEDSTNGWAYFSFILPIAVVFVAIYKTSVGQELNIEKLDIRSPLKINETYGNFVIALAKSIKRAKFWVAMATVAVLIGGSVSLYLLNTEKQKRAEAEKIEQREDKIQGYKDDNEKAFAENKKLHVTFNEDANKITIEAQFVEHKVLVIEMKTIEDKTDLIKVQIPALCDYKAEISNVKALIKTTIK
ncbi:hypothetical protein [uncultured Psychroserpens sp.]|uniref:hypothetical protein n=1 Tax=uncultured Psychroserpens sp. TaxID=255436 RepID=UPI00262BB018|nr:hypothetical protein [uncultured Psychroserpens sp.]